MEQENKGGVFDLESYNDLEGKSAGGGTKPTLEVGTASNPLIMKLAFDPRWGRKATYLEVKYHKFFSQYSNSPRSSRKYLCLSNYGDKCPACEAFFAAYNEKSKLAKAGQPIPAILDSTIAMHKGSNGAWVIGVTPSSDCVKPLKIPFSLQLILFGGKDRSGNPIKGLVAEMKEKGRSPFDLRNDKGWIRAWKVGEGLDTEYFATEAFDAVIEQNADGEEIERRRYLQAKVGPKVFGLTLEDIPVALDCEYDSAKWTMAEVSRYVETDGVERPARAMQQSRDGGATAENTGPSKADDCTKIENYEQPPWAMKDSEVPFAPGPEKVEVKAEVKAAPKTVEEVKPIPHLASVVVPPGKVNGAPVQPKPRKVIDELDDLT